MLAKKVLAVAASLTIAIPAFAFSSLAAPGDVVTLGDKNVKIWSDFENQAEGRIGQKGNNVWKNTSGGKNNDVQGANFAVEQGKGVDGSKGLFFGLNATNTIVDSNPWCEGAIYNAEADTPSQTNWVGATDFVFWVDGTTYPEAEYNLQCILSEWDINEDGSVDMNGDEPVSSSWGPYEAVYYTLENGSWVKRQAAKGSYNITLPSSFTGYVSVPLDSFVNYWGSTDSDGEFNLVHVTAVNWYHYFYQKDATNGGAFAIDNLAFAGDFQPIETTTTAATDASTTAATDASTTAATDASTTAATDASTTAATDASTTAATDVSTTAATDVSTTAATDASTTAVTDASTTAATAATTTAATTKAATTTAKAATTTEAASTTTASVADNSNPKTGETPITAALLTAVTFAGVLFVSKKRSK